MALVRWTLTDYAYATPVSYTFEVNPNAGGSPARKRNYTQKPTSALTGKPLIFQGAEEPEQFEWSGVLLEETQLNALAAWQAKRHQVYLTDDLGRSFWIYIVAFDAKRKRSAVHPWMHEYTVKATKLDWE